MKWWVSSYRALRAALCRYGRDVYSAEREAGSQIQPEGYVCKSVTVRHHSPRTVSKFISSSGVSLQLILWIFVAQCLHHWPTWKVTGGKFYPGWSIRIDATYSNIHAILQKLPFSIVVGIFIQILIKLIPRWSWCQVGISRIQFCPKNSHDQCSLHIFCCTPSSFPFCYSPLLSCSHLT